MDARQIYGTDRTDKRLEGDEPDMGGHDSEQIEA
jgi:hypothetical protein